MRHSEQLTLSKRRTVTVHELRVIDVRNMMLQPQEATVNANIIQGCISLQTDQLSDTDNARISAAFVRINQAFYGSSTKSETKTDQVQQLDKTCCHLIERGHASVFDYGWRFFLTCIEQHQN
jgi:hypothetical protein